MYLHVQPRTIIYFYDNFYVKLYNNYNKLLSAEIISHGVVSSHLGYSLDVTNLHSNQGTPTITVKNITTGHNL